MKYDSIKEYLTKLGMTHGELDRFIFSIIWSYLV